MDKKLKKIFAKIIGVKETSIKSNTSPKNTKKWDSLTHINFILALQKKFKIKINDEDAMNILSYDDAIKYIKKRTNVK